MTPIAAVRTVDSTARYFTTADALHGYWQIELAEEDRHLTTFITPYGRYYYCRGPMGFAATGDAYCYRGDLALQGLTKCVKVVDDVLLFDDDLLSHYKRIQELLTRCRSHGITLNRDKFIVAATKVNFCGYTLSDKGIAADPDRVAALRDFPTPANLTDLRSFMGLANQLAEFTPEIAKTAKPLRPLLSPSRSFTWTPDHDLAFKQVKKALSSPPILAAFDPGLPTYLQTDASRLYGIGYALLQDHGSSQLRLVQCGSRFLADAETRYATIELEMLAVSWALQKCRLYLTGLQSFTVHTDHRPLVPILNSYTLDMIENPRLQRLRERMSHFTFRAVWRAGKTLRIPDAFSRAPVSRPTPEDTSDSASTMAHLRSVIPSAAYQEDAAPRIEADRHLQELANAAQQDSDYVRLRDCILAGFPANRYSLHTSLLPYWKLRDSLSVDGSLVLLGARIVIPAALRRQTLARLHDSHRGVEATKRRSRQTVFWPGIDSDITNTVAACESCQLLRPSQQQEPLLNDDKPTRPFESVSADFFQVAGKHFLVIVDRLSNWPAVIPCKSDTTASSTIRYFCSYFREVGVPLRLRTDGGPPFSSSEFADFTRRWGIQHFTSSPHYPQSNGHAEAAVKAVKRLIMATAPSGNINCEAFDRGLMELRNVPNHTGCSPAQVLFGHNLRSCVPAHPQSFKSDWKDLADDWDRRVASRAAQVKKHYNQHARDLPRLAMGQHVRVQDPTSRRWDKVAIVMGGARSREYEVRLPSGRVLRRNRRFLYPVPDPHSDTTPNIPVVPCRDMEKSNFQTDMEKSNSVSPPKTPRRSPRLNKS
ncbi:MAG: RNase H-like domain-containing protein [Mangrovibacterium sp.]